MGPISKSSEIPFVACKFAYVVLEKKTIAKDLNIMFVSV